MFGTGTAWPDLAVAGLMAALALNGGWQVLRQARREMNAVGGVGPPSAPRNHHSGITMTTSIDLFELQHLTQATPLLDVHHPV